MVRPCFDICSNCCPSLQPIDAAFWCADLLSDEDEDLEDNAPLVPAHPSAAAAQAASSTTNQQRSQQQQQQPVGAPPPGVLRPGIVHRLDKGTSGLMVVAKDDLAHMRLCEQFKARTVS